MSVGELEPILPRKVRVAPSATVRSLPDGSAIVLDMESERYFGLDSVGSEMWEALTTKPSVADARTALLNEFAVDEERLDTDLLEFVQALQSRGLVVFVDDDSGGG